MGPKRSRAPLTDNRYLRRLYRADAPVLGPRVRWGLIATGLVLYTAQFVGGDRGLLHRLELRKEYNQVTAINASLTVERDALLREVNLRENDPLSLERTAREKFWMAYEDELIYRFEDDELVPDLSPDGTSGWERPVDEAEATPETTSP